LMSAPISSGRREADLESVEFKIAGGRLGPGASQPSRPDQLESFGASGWLLRSLSPMRTAVFRDHDRKCRGYV
jgi:hypothetical protein